MINPAFLKFFPQRLQHSLVSRFFYPVADRWHRLFVGARLKLAPEIRMNLLPSDLMHAHIALTGSYEWPLTRRIARIARRGGVMVDVGANAGYFSLLWSALNQSNVSFAFEASPKVFKLLEKNVKINRLEKRMKIYPFALGVKNEKLDFNPGPGEQTGWGGLTLKQDPNNIQVNVKRLDELFDLNQKIDILKIDVEGADTWVLLGAEKLLRAKCIKEVFFEQNKPRLLRLNIGENEACEFLKTMGYHVFPLNPPVEEIVEWKAVPEGHNK